MIPKEFLFPFWKYNTGSVQSDNNNNNNNMKWSTIEDIEMGPKKGGKKKGKKDGGDGSGKKKKDAADGDVLSFKEAVMTYQ